MKPITGEVLYNKLCDFLNLVIDTRPSHAYMQGHIRHAVHYDPLDQSEDSPFFDFDDFWNHVAADMDYESVVIYEEECYDTGRITELIPHLAEKVESLFILQDGYSMFSQKYPYLCKNSCDSDEDDERVYPSVIIDGFLYLGDQVSADDIEVLDNLGIRYVVNATVSPNPFENQHPSKRDLRKFCYLNCHIEDYESSDIRQHFKSTKEFIDKARTQNGRVLVHCAAGMSRSPTLMISYLMQRNKWTLRQSFLYVRERRPIIYPNAGFIAQLIEFEKECYGTASMKPDDFA